MYTNRITGKFIYHTIILLSLLVFFISCKNSFVSPNVIPQEASEAINFPDSQAIGEFETDDELISFSHASGFYDTDFSLQLSTSEEGTILYTFDSKTAFKYLVPIAIKDATEHENVYSMRDDISLGYSEGEYELPQYKIDKCVVVKACIQYADGTYSPVQTRTYFVGLKDKKSIAGIGVASISLNPDSLFDYEDGIYVLGKDFDDNNNYYEELPAEQFWWWANGNFREKGKTWEKKAFIQFFDKDGNLQVSQPCGIRIKGGGSRGYPQKSFNLYARKDYGDNYKKFKYDFFGTKYKAKKLTLFTGADDNVTKTMDYVAHTACQDRNCESVEFSTFHFVPYALFLNGEYWGMYWLTEAYDDNYLKETYKLASDDVVMIKNGEVEEGEETDLDLWNESQSFISENDMSDSENFARAQELIDLKSFVQYYAAEMYIGRYNDWPGSNIAVWRSRDKTEDFSDGRWRWMLFDINSGSMEQYFREKHEYHFDCIRHVVEKDSMFSSFMKNAEFQQMLRDELLYDSETRFEAQKIIGIIDTAESEYLGNLEESVRRWNGSCSTFSIQDALEQRRNFFNNRKQAVEMYINENLDLLE